MSWSPQFLIDMSIEKFFVHGILVYNVSGGTYWTGWKIEYYSFCLVGVLVAENIVAIVSLHIWDNGKGKGGMGLNAKGREDTHIFLLRRRLRRE